MVIYFVFSFKIVAFIEFQIVNKESEGAISYSLFQEWHVQFSMVPFKSWLLVPMVGISSFFYLEKCKISSLSLQHKSKNQFKIKTTNFGWDKLGFLSFS